MSRLSLADVARALGLALGGAVLLVVSVWVGFERARWAQPAPSALEVEALARGSDVGCALELHGQAAQASQVWVEWIALEAEGGFAATGTAALARTGGEWHGEFVTPLAPGQRLIWRAGARNGAHEVYSIGAIVEDCAPSATTHVYLNIAK